LTNFHRIHYADHCGVDWTLLALESHSGRATLHDKNNLVNTCADCVDRDHMALFIFAIDANQARDKQLAPVKAVVLPSRYYGPNYSSKNHNQWSSGQWSVVSGGSNTR
jgi:hypothetical protein